MTRKEQIEQAAKEYAAPIEEEYWHGTAYDSFYIGAEWADAWWVKQTGRQVDETMANLRDKTFNDHELLLKLNSTQAQLAVAVEALEHCADKMMSKKAKEALAKIKGEK